MPAASINNAIGKRFIELLRVDSTNNYAMQRLQNGDAEHGDVYFAFEQTAGKGQFDKQWLSLKGENIILSVIVSTASLNIEQSFILNMLAALSAQQLFNKYSAEKAKIKWPNDIYWRDRKAAGILIESGIRGTKWQYSVMGFGININQVIFPDKLKNPVSLKQVTGKTYNVTTLAKELCLILQKNMQLLYAGNDEVILKQYNSELYKLNQSVQFKKGHSVFFACVSGVDRKGKLIIENSGQHTYESGAIEWIQG